MPKLNTSNIHTAGVGNSQENDTSDIDELLENIDNSPPQQNQTTTNQQETPTPTEAPQQAQPQESFTENQTQSMIVLVWILLIISIICIVMTNIFGSKNNSSKKDLTEEVAPTYLENTVQLDQIACEEDVWKSDIVVSKKIQVTNGNIIPILYGYDNNYNKEMTIPVTMDEYNSVNEGDVVEINYSRLKIDGIEVAIIKKYKIKTMNEQGLEPIID